LGGGHEGSVGPVGRSPALDGPGARLDWIEMDWVGLAGSGSGLPVNSRSLRDSLGRELQFFSPLRRKIIRLRCVCDLILRRPTVLAALDYYCFGISVVTLARNQRLHGLRMVFLGSGHDF